MSRKRQLEFMGEGFHKPGDQFGGSLLKGNAKAKRPLASKLPIHLTLRAEKSVLRMPKTFAAVQGILDSVSAKYGVTVYKFANVGNHLHLVIKLRNLDSWAPFIREVSGRIAQVVGELLNLKLEKFWKFKPHTRIVRGWKRAFRSAMDYVRLNQLEAEGRISRNDIRSLKDLRLIWTDG